MSKNSDRSTSSSSANENIERSEGEDSQIEIGIEQQEPNLVSISENQREALNPSWILKSRDQPLLELVISISYAVTWASNVEKVFFFNSNKKKPDSWFGLGKAVGHDPNGFSRYNPRRGGRDPVSNNLRLPNTHLRYATSIALGSDETNLSPDNISLLSVASETLLDLTELRSEYTDKVSCFLYAEYVWFNWIKNGEVGGILDEEILTQVSHNTDEDREQLINRILKTADAIAVALSYNQIEKLDI